MKNVVENEIVFVGPVSLPTTGRVVVTKHVFAALLDAGAKIKLFDVSRKFGLAYPLFKLFTFLRAAAHCVFGRLERRPTVYLVADDKNGLYFDLLLALCCFWKIPRFVVHHHSSRYVMRYDWRIQFLVNILGERALHVVQCEKLGEEMRALYGNNLNYLELSNAAWVDSAGRRREDNGREILVLGHLSNLCASKGLYEVLDFVFAMMKRGVRLKLILAGPFFKKTDKLRVGQIVSDYPDVFELRGAVYGKDKSDFFGEIDVFLFPSRARSETEGIVTLESMSHGVPFIAYEVGCISRYADLNVGTILPLGVSLVEEVEKGTFDWITDPKERKVRGDAAFSVFSRLKGTAQDSLNELVAYMT